jgi:hypothetical protein
LLVHAVPLSQKESFVFQSYIDPRAWGFAFDASTHIIAHVFVCCFNHACAEDDDDDDDGGLAGLMSPSYSPSPPPPRPPKNNKVLTPADPSLDPLANNPFASGVVVRPSSTPPHSAGANRAMALAVWRSLLERLEAAIAAKQYVSEWVAIEQRKPVSLMSLINVCERGQRTTFPSFVALFFSRLVHM